MTFTQDQPLLGSRILVAEDDAILAFDIVSLLQNAGAEVLGPVTTLTDTIAIARSASLSCALLDVNLRDEDVFPAAQLLKQRCVRIVFQTGCGEPERLRQEWPDAAVLTKPVPSSLLIRTVWVNITPGGPERFGRAG